MKVKLTQEKLAERPTDVVKLSCEIIGVLQNQTGHFWWLLDESSHLLYMFSVMKYIVEYYTFRYIDSDMIWFNHPFYVLTCLLGEHVVNKTCIISNISALRSIASYLVCATEHM